MTFRTREEWLLAAAHEVAVDVFGEHEISVPQVRISVGFPGGPGKKSGVIGQCWNTGATEDGRPAIFIHPSLNDRVEILGCMVHELIHAVDDCASGHKGSFVKMFRLLGMTGKPTQCAVGDELRVKLKDIATRLGVYPHSAIKKGASTRRKQGTRMLKVVCLGECGYTLRTTRQWLDTGLPTCACGAEMGEA